MCGRPEEIATQWLRPFSVLVNREGWQRYARPVLAVDTRWIAERGAVLCDLVVVDDRGRMAWVGASECEIVA